MVQNGNPKPIKNTLAMCRQMTIVTSNRVRHGWDVYKSLDVYPFVFTFFLLAPHAKKAYCYG